MTPRLAAALALALASSPLVVAGGEGASARGAVAVNQRGAVDSVDMEQRLGARIDASLRFTDPDGRRVALADSLDGERPLILVLAYYRCPMLCGLVLRSVALGLRQLDWKLGEKYRALTVSFDPRDTPEAARRKRASTLEGLGALAGATASDWPFLVGEEREIRALADGLGFRFAYDPDTDQYAHPAASFVLTPDGRISRVLYGATIAPLDLRLALLEASQGRTGNVAERALLTCYRYDPASRRYGPYVAGFLRLGGGVIAAAVGALLALFWRGESRRRREREGHR